MSRDLKASEEQLRECTRRNGEWRRQAESLEAEVAALRGLTPEGLRLTNDSLQRRLATLEEWLAENQRRQAVLQDTLATLKTALRTAFARQGNKAETVSFAGYTFDCYTVDLTRSKLSDSSGKTKTASH